MTRILLVDDEPEMLEAWRFALEYAGHKIETAADGREALDILQRTSPDMLITDLMMPGINGRDLCRAIRDNVNWARLPIILHTAARVTTTETPVLWNAVIRKPARIEVFLATIAKLEGSRS